MEASDRINPDRGPKLTPTPWGHVQSTEKIAEGVTFVQTAGHGGLALSRTRWRSLPAELQASLMNQRFAEEDCELPIVMTMLGLEVEQCLEPAIRAAQQHERYAAVLPALQEIAKNRQAAPGGHQNGPR